MLHGPSVGVHNLGQRGSRVHMACRIKFYAITGSGGGLDESELMSGGGGGVGGGWWEDSRRAGQTLQSRREGFFLVLFLLSVHLLKKRKKKEKTLKVCPCSAGLRVPEFQIKRCRHFIAI